MNLEEQQWTVRMASAPQEFETTRIVAAKLLGVSAVVTDPLDRDAAPYFTAIVQVGCMGCPLEITREGFIKLSLLLGRGEHLLLMRTRTSSTWQVDGLYPERECSELAEHLSSWLKERAD